MRHAQWERRRLSFGLLFDGRTIFYNRTRLLYRTISGNYLYSGVQTSFTAFGYAEIHNEYTA